MLNSIKMKFVNTLIIHLSEIKREIFCFIIYSHVDYSHARNFPLQRLSVPLASGHGCIFLPFSILSANMRLVPKNSWHNYSFCNAFFWIYRVSLVAVYNLFHYRNLRKMPISANNRVMCLSDHSRVVGLLAIFDYLLDMSKISHGTIPCSLLGLNILRRFL